MQTRVDGNLNPIVSVNRLFFDAINLGGYWSDETVNEVIVHNINWLKRK